MSAHKKKIMVFGVLDGLHKGHQFFLREARKHGDILTVSLACETAVRLLKNRVPKFSFEERKKALLISGLVDNVIMSDEEAESWVGLSRLKPDVIVLGHDQEVLYEALMRAHKYFDFSIHFKVAEAFEPKTYNSTRLFHANEYKV